MRNSDNSYSHSWAMARALGAVVLTGIVLLAGGCATTGPGVPIEIEIPVPAQCPVPDMPERPHLDIGDLPPEAMPADVMRAYATSLQQCTGYAGELEALLRAYGDAGKAVR